MATKKHATPKGSTKRDGKAAPRNKNGNATALLIGSVKDELAELNKAVDKLIASNERASQVVPIVSLAPRPFSVLREIPILVEAQLSENSEDVEFVARFVEANVGSCGDTLEEAIRNVKDRLVGKFDFLDRCDPNKLAPALRMQLAVLRSVMKRTE